MSTETRTPTATTMRAVAHDRYGPPDVLELRDVPRPTIAADEVLVEVRAAGVDRGVWHYVTGLPYPFRLAGIGLRAPKRPVPGSDLAGVVAAVGADITRFAPGDEVFGIGIGTFAEFARAPERKLAPKPAELTFEQAAAVPVSALTALQALRDHGKVQPGEQVLVIGASGGVGSYLVQLAKAFGATVTGVARTSKVDLVRNLGADHVIDHQREDVTGGDRRYDLILDTGGNTPLRALRRALTPGGRLTIVGAENGGRWLGGSGRALLAPLVSLLAGQDLGKPWVCRENHEDLLVLAELIRAGKLTPAVDRTFPLRDAAVALQHLVDGHARGKVVITVGGPS
jgi:NADPH:quinone reductase-like Zn-dependent oxidoreductase